MKRSLLAAAAVAVALPGLLRDVSVYFWRAGPLHTVRVDDRYRGLLLPATGEVGFVTGGGPAEGRRYFDALYHFAPRILTLRPAAPRLLADTGDDVRLRDLCARLRLRVVARGGPGVALLEHE